jgi:hypothetical protein
LASTYSHRILTEDVNRQAIIEILSKYFESFNVAETTGYWKGKAEKSLSIELIGSAYADVRRASEEIRIANNQEAILIFSVTGKSSLIIA